MILQPTHRAFQSDIHINWLAIYLFHCSLSPSLSLSLSLSLPPPPFSPAYDNEFPSSTITDVDYLCPETEDVQPAKSDSPVVALLVVFIVLLIILIAVGVVVGVMFFLCYKRMKNFRLDKLDGTSNGDGHFSAASDITNKATPNVYKEPCHSAASTLQRSEKGSVLRCVLTN